MEVAEMPQNEGAPGETNKGGREASFKTVGVTGRQKEKSFTGGGHEPEGPEAIAYLPEGFRRVAEDVQHAICSLRGGGFQRLRLMPPT